MGEDINIKCISFTILLMGAFCSGRAGPCQTWRLNQRKISSKVDACAVCGVGNLLIYLPGNAKTSSVDNVKLSTFFCPYRLGAIQQDI